MSMQMPTPEHTEFDQICARVEDWEPLPTVAAPTVAAAPPESGQDEVGRSLNEQILAALVSPY